MSMIDLSTLDPSQISGIGDFGRDKSDYGEVFTVKSLTTGEMKPFLIRHHNTVEVRTDGNLAKLLKEQYESVMDSRYFGRGGIEVVLSGQIPTTEIADLIRLSYNLSTQK